MTQVATSLISGLGFLISSVFRYSVRLQNGLECGGAYIKLLLADKNRKPEDFSNETPYLLMFGPDRCGTTQKTHFILRHQNPLNLEWEEKHYNPSVPPKSDRLSHLYTLEIRPDNQVRIYIDGEQMTAGTLLENMVPPISPPGEIDDPEDKKPANWIDAKTISDLTATKPANWDQPATIYNDNAIKPDDWDDDVDGEWEPPQMPNPDYKGEWKPPQIPNPDYMGEWKPKRIPNPNFFVDEHPHNLPEIDGIGFELWTMNDGIVFDNIIVTTNKALADVFGKVGFTQRSTEENRVTAERKAALEKESNEVDSAGKLFSVVMAYMSANPIVAAAVFIAAVGLLTVFTYAVTLCCGGGSAESEEEEEEPNNKKKTSVKGKAKQSDDEDDAAEEATDEANEKVAPESTAQLRKSKAKKT